MLEILSTILGSLDKKVILPSSAHPSIFKRTQVRDLCCMYAIITFIRRWVKSESRNSSGYDTYRLGAPIFYIVAHYNPERAASRRVVKLYLASRHVPTPAQPADASPPEEGHQVQTTTGTRAEVGCGTPATGYWGQLPKFAVQLQSVQTHHHQLSVRCLSGHHR